MNKTMEKTVIFLGAGASKAEGAPIQSEMISQFFRLESLDEEFLSARSLLLEFLEDVFGMDTQGHHHPYDYPKFEELLGVIDLALARGEQLGSVVRNLHLVREKFIYLMGKTLEEKIDARHGVHRNLIDILCTEDRIDNMTFVSTNYDTLADDAIAGRRHVNYGPFAPEKKDGVFLYKLHGSLNWTQCSGCGKFRVGAARWEPCALCGGTRRSIIVPPKYNKNLKNKQLKEVWKRARKVVAAAEHIIFCGYSFPDADINVKYLLKQGELHGPPPRVTVVNGFDEEGSDKHYIEAGRYRRFYAAPVNYTGMTFQKFVEEPAALLALARP
ncbi:MAG: SIR2 family protein [Anaerovoracaceae bacterium]